MLVIYKDLLIVKIKKSATSIQHSTLFQLLQIFMAQQAHESKNEIAKY